MVVLRALLATPSIRHVPSDEVVPTLVDGISKRLKRRIEITAAPLPQRISAAWTSTVSIEFIEYSHSVPPAAALLGILHEIGHILCGHGTQVEAQHSNLTALAPSLSPELSARLLRRTSSQIVLSTREEAEAELYARIIYRRILRAYAIECASPGSRAFNLAATPWND
ncbi:hypothetical protein [Nocardia sp. NPDC058705]|uniref:hypothetical protein n=1 Tax=Nocardia sp. NPDC058705 TaxID=3346609 RepID=UPI0036ABDBDA